MTQNNKSDIGKLAWHFHHKILCESLPEELQTRLEFIDTDKRRDERALRRRLLALVVQPLNNAEWDKADAKWREARAEWVKADAKWREAHAKWREADAEWDKADAKWRETYAEWGKARAEWNKARAEWVEADAEWDKADAEWDKADAKWREADAEWGKDPVVVALHADQCPDCPWDGTTIFTRENEQGEWY